MTLLDPPSFLLILLVFASVGAAVGIPFALWCAWQWWRQRMVEASE